MVGTPQCTPCGKSGIHQSRGIHSSAVKVSVILVYDAVRHTD
jgi:hypothetical protein